MITTAFCLLIMTQTQPSTNCEALAARVAMLESRLAVQTQAAQAAPCPPPVVQRQVAPQPSCYTQQATPQAVYTQPPPAITYAPPPAIIQQQAAPQASCYAVQSAPQVMYTPAPPVAYQQSASCPCQSGLGAGAMALGSRGIGGIGGIGGLGGQQSSFGSRGLPPGAALLSFERRGIFGRRAFDISTDGLGGSRSSFMKMGLLGRFERAQTLSCGPGGCYP